MVDNYNFFIDKNNVDVRIDVFLTSVIKNVTRNHIHHLINEKNVSVNKNTISKNYKLKINDEVFVNIPASHNVDILAQDIPLNIVYEDESILVVNKEKGMIVHPANNLYENTLVNAIMYHCKGKLSGINGEIRPGIVHRIDKNTSGLLVIAKDDYSHNFLSAQLKEHTIFRKYMCVCHGNFKLQSGTIDKKIGRHPKDRKKMAVVADGKSSITHYRVIENYDKFSLLELQLETGRTHQIRVHLASINKPVAGDNVYGIKNYIKHLNGQCLHAKTLGFVHPKTKKEVFFDSDLPEYFSEFIINLKKGVGYV